VNKDGIIYFNLINGENMENNKIITSVSNFSEIYYFLKKLMELNPDVDLSALAYNNGDGVKLTYSVKDLDEGSVNYKLEPHYLNFSIFPHEVTGKLFGVFYRIKLDKFNNTKNTGNIHFPLKYIRGIENYKVNDILDSNILAIILNDLDLITDNIEAIVEENIDDLYYKLKVYIKDDSLNLGSLIYQNSFFVYIKINETNFNLNETDSYTKGFKDLFVE